MAPNFAWIPLGFVLIGCLTTSVLMNQLSSDCMKNPFATGCRGISAKRSAEWQLGRQIGATNFDLLTENGQQEQQQQQRPQVILNKFSRAKSQESSWPMQALAARRSMQSLGATELLIEAAIKLLEDNQSMATQVSDGHQRLVNSMPSIASANGQATLRSGKFAPGGE